MIGDEADGSIGHRVRSVAAMTAWVASHANNLYCGDRDVGVDVDQMVRDASDVREGLPVLALSQSDPSSIDELAQWVRTMSDDHRDGRHTPHDPGPMAPHSHVDEHEHLHE